MNCQMILPLSISSNDPPAREWKYRDVDSTHLCFTSRSPCRAHSPSRSQGPAVPPPPPPDYPIPRRCCWWTPPLLQRRTATRRRAAGRPVGHGQGSPGHLNYSKDDKILSKMYCTITENAMYLPLNKKHAAKERMKQMK